MKKLKMNKQNQISAKSKEFKDLVKQLQRVISKLPKDQHKNRDILHLALKKEGWTQEEIAVLSKASHVSKHTKNKKRSPFEAARNRLTNPQALRGGAPGLGKGKS